MKKSNEWVAGADVGITVDNNTGSAGRKNTVKNMPTVGEEYGLLIIPGGYQEANTFEECCQWAICA